MDSFTQIVRYNPMCVVIPYTTKTINAVFYAVYLHQICERLRLSFDGSHLALSKWTVLMIRIVIILIPAIVCILILIDSAGDSLQCLRSWYPMDVDVKLTYCDIPWDSLSLLKEYGLYALLTLGMWFIFAFLQIDRLRVMDHRWTTANIVNVSLGIVFVVKLKRISSQTTNEKINIQFRNLIVRNTTLTLVGCCSSFLGYLLYAGTELASWVYLDSFTNCMCFGCLKPLISTITNFNILTKNTFYEQVW